MPTELTLRFPPLKILELDGLITWEWLEPKISDRLETGVSICVTRTRGVAMRGGYFFHFQKTDKGFEFSTFDRPVVLTLSSGDECADFMNHVSGRQYDEEMWRKCQEVNLRPD